MFETPIYDALMQEYNSRRGHVNSLMEPHMDAKTLRKNIALKKEDEEPEYTRTSTGEALTPTCTVKPFLSEADLTNEFVDESQHHWRKKFVDNLPPSDPEVMARKGGISYNLSLLFEDNIHMLDLKKEGCSWQNYVSGVTDKIISENPGCVVRSVDSKREIDGTTTVYFRGDPAPEVDETQAMDFRGYFDKKEGE